MQFQAKFPVIMQPILQLLRPTPIVQLMFLGNIDLLRGHPANSSMVMQIPFC